MLPPPSQLGTLDLHYPHFQGGEPLWAYANSGNNYALAELLKRDDFTPHFKLWKLTDQDSEPYRKELKKRRREILLQEEEFPCLEKKQRSLPE